MPIQFTAFPENRLIYGVGAGMLSNQDLVDLITRIFADPGFDPGLDELWDFTRSNPEEVSFNGLFRAVQMGADCLRTLRKQSPARAKCAVVVATSAQFGMARMYQSISDAFSMETEVFQDRAAALKWLGLEPEWEPSPCPA
jgi:hypothetical protein